MAPTAHPTIGVQAPQPNTVLNSGDVLTVSGLATGTPGTEPSPGHPGVEAVSIDTVTVALAGLPPIEAALTPLQRGPHQAPTARFEATLTVPAVGGNQQLKVIGVADNGVLVRANVPVIIQTHVPPPPWTTSQLGPAGSLPGAARLTAIAKPSGCELWWVGADGAVNGVWSEPGSAWASYQLAAPGSAARAGGITAVPKGGDVMEVWWIGPDGSVQAAYHDSAWHLYTLAGAGAAAVTGGITSVFKGGDSMEVWWAAPDGSVTGAYHEGNWQTYTLAGPGSASTTCRITSAYGGSLVARLMRVWWVDATGGSYQAFFDSQWSVSLIGAGGDPAGATVGVLFNADTPTAFWARSDGSLVDAFPPEITLSTRVSGGRGLRGTVWLTLREDGSTRWHGDVTNHEAYGYHFGLSVYAPTGTSADIGAAHHGHVAGWGEPGSSNDIWDEEHPSNPMLAHALAAYRFSALALKLEHSVDVVDYLKAAIDVIFEAAEGTVLGGFGAVVVIGVEIGSLIATGSLVPGAIIVGGVPWLAGPAGIFVRALVTATNSDGRQLTQEEYAWANDKVFRGSLPPIDSFRMTNYVGVHNLPFTFPTFGGPTLVNVGKSIFSNLHVDEKTVIHELTHVCQIAHSHDVVFTATAIATQLKYQFTDVYDYGAAGFQFTGLGLEAQAEVVEDWFLGFPAKRMSPDPRNHTNKAMDAQSPYYRYITGNLRVGLF